VTGRTPDFRVFQAGELVAFCEVKSPRDEWIDELLDFATPGQFVGGLRDDSTFNRIARHVEKAATQFEAVNKDRVVPNILVFVNHDDASSYNDLRETVTGDFHSQSGERFETVSHISEGKIRVSKHKIDVYVWVDAHARRVEGYVYGRSSKSNTIRAFELLGVEVLLPF
jgi:hypothetical protein